MKLSDSMSNSSLIIWTDSKFIWDNFLEGSSFISVVENRASWNQVEPVLLDLIRYFVLEKLASVLGRGGLANIFLFLLMCIFAYMYVSQAVGTHGSQKIVSDAWNWSYGWLQTSMWGLQAQLGFSTRATSALSHQTIFFTFSFLQYFEAMSQEIYSSS